MEGGIIIEDQISLLSIQSLSNVFLSNVTLCNITNMKSSLIFLDQSMLQVNNGGLVVRNTSNIDNPVIDVQSDSDFICLYCDVSDQKGLFFNVKDSRLQIVNSTMRNLIFTEDDLSVIKVQSSTLIMNGTSLRNITTANFIPTLSVVKLRDSQFSMDSCHASQFTLNLINAVNSQIQVNRSTF